MTKRRSIRLLGRFEIEEAGHPATMMKYAKGCALLAYLIVTGHPQRRENIADLLWEGGSTKQALGTLRRLLHRVRPHVPELYASRTEITYHVSDDVSIDLLTLRAGLASDDIEQLSSALALYRGGLLAEFYLDDAPRFSEWLLIAREQLRQEVWAAYRRLCAAYSEQQQWTAGVAATRRWLALDPLDEAILRQLLRFLIADGQHEEAVAQYETSRQRLWDELGVEPEPATVDVSTQIRAEQQSGRVLQQPVAFGRTHHWGEAPNVEQFFGRDVELNQLVYLLSAEPAHIITILGIGGQGKTALAATAARAHADLFTGIYWRSLINAPPPDMAIREIYSFLVRNQKLPPKRSLPN